jgi:tetrahydromethanopterin S-methyltransferase subunit G
MGENTTFEQLKHNIQAVIDLLAIRKLKEANNRLQSIQEHIEATFGHYLQTICWLLK